MKNEIQSSFDDYLLRKRKEAIPFTEDSYYEEINNDEIYKDLK